MLRHWSDNSMSDRLGRNRSSHRMYLSRFQDLISWWLQLWKQRRLSSSGKRVYDKTECVVERGDVILNTKYKNCQVYGVPAATGVQELSVKKIWMTKIDAFKSCYPGENCWECPGLLQYVSFININLFAP